MSAVADVATREQKKINLWHFVTWKKVCAVLLLALLCAVVYFVRSYQKFTHALFDYARYSTVKEDRNLNFCLGYFLFGNISCKASGVNKLTIFCKYIRTD